ncbi:MAG: hypothetical protein NZ484_00290, partial [Patescibacteria group bacterium]|nr:hypothetical protein [Patescibacteria group bacterium]
SIYELGTDLNLAPFVGGLVGYWSFDEGSGTIAYDRSGYDNHLTVYSSTTPVDLFTNIDCKKGFCLNLSGINNCARKNNPAGMSFTKEFSLIAWIKTSDNGGKILGRWNGMQWNHMLTVGEPNDGKLRLMLDKDGGAGSYDAVRVSNISVNDN